MIRAKFRCVSIRKYESNIWNPQTNRSETGFLYAYEFYPTSSKEGEDAKFFASTPSGKLEMSAVANDLFVPGKYYYLDFNETP